jgi:hypothetical protein
MSLLLRRIEELKEIAADGVVDVSDIHVHDSNMYMRALADRLGLSVPLAMDLSIPISEVQRLSLLV